MALAYYRAWTSGDLDRAVEHLAAEVVCEAPPGRLTGAEEVRGFMGPFAATLTSSRLIAAHGDDESALIMYDTSTRAVPRAPGAEHYRVVDGRIVEMHVIFDRLPFALARGDVLPRQE